MCSDHRGARALYAHLLPSPSAGALRTDSVVPNGKSQPDEIQPNQVADFVKEFCNLTAGNIKQALEKSSVLTGISLPLVTRGFDELVFASTGPQYLRDQWRIAMAEVFLDCSVITEIYDQITFSGEESAAEDLGEVEFL